MTKRIAILCLLLGLLVGCSEPGPELAEEPFRFEDHGFAIRHPEGWSCGMDDYFGVPACAHAPEGDDDAVVMVLLMSEIGDYPEDQARASAEEFSQVFCEESEGLELRSLRVDGREAAVADCPGDSFEDTFYAAVVHLGDRRVTAWAMFIDVPNVSEEWEAFGPIFDAMVSSLTFFEPAER